MLQSQTFIQIRDHCVSDSYFQYYAMVASNANGAMYINQLKMYSCTILFFCSSGGTIDSICMEMRKDNIPIYICNLRYVFSSRYT